MTNSTTLARFNELIEAGYRIDEISSTWEHVVVEMDDGSRRTTVRLGPEAAQAVAGTLEGRGTQRITAEASL